ncbi:hypothetical protein K474DRAFT_1773994 [Panus rudis PR-1116 ss-1]|nr:hypothetical protein K474DRAFT_1773994 [Panus rudis PR-1116 ss-1]
MTSHNTTIEDSSPMFLYDGPWQDTPQPNAADIANYTGYTSPTYHVLPSDQSGLFTLQDMRATAIYVYATLYSGGGTFNTTLLGYSEKKFNVLDEFSSGTSASADGRYVYQALIYSRTGLSRDLYYLLQINITGGFLLDYAVVENTIGDEGSSWHNITLDDTSPAFSYIVDAVGNTWRTVNDSSSSAFNGTEHWTYLDYGTVQIDFRGSGIEVYGSYHNTTYYVAFNGTNHQYGEPNAHSSRPRELLWSIDGLEEGAHNVTISNFLLDHDSVTDESSQLWIDCAVVFSTDASNIDGLVTASPGAQATSGTSTSAGTATPMIPSGSTSTHSTNFGPIVGAAVGGLALLLIILTTTALFVYLRKKRQHVRRLDLVEDDPPFRSPDMAPYTDSDNPNAQILPFDSSASSSSNQLETRDIVMLKRMARGSRGASVTSPLLSQYGHRAHSSISSEQGMSYNSRRLSREPHAGFTASGTLMSSSPSSMPSRTPSPYAGSEHIIQELDAGAVQSDPEEIPSLVPPVYDPSWAPAKVAS